MQNDIPAFPFSTEVDESKPNQFLSMGMSLKDYYAGQALLGYLSNGSSMNNAIEWSWQTAERMMKEREKIKNKI